MGKNSNSFELTKSKSKVSVLGAFTVREGERVVQMRFGKKVSEHEPGIGLGLPAISEIQTIGIRPILYQTSFSVLTDEFIPLEFHTNLIYRVSDIDSLIKRAPEWGHLEKMVHGFLRGKITADVFNRNGIKEVLSKREIISDSVRDYVKKFVEPWGITVDSVLFEDIRPPSFVTELQKEFYALNIQKGLEEDKAKIYKTRTNARVEAMEKFYSMIGKVSELCDPRDRWLVLCNLISEDGSETPFSRLFETAMEGKRQGVMARNIAGEIETEPSFPYTVEAMRDVYKTVKPQYFWGGEGMGSISDIYAQEKEIMNKLYPNREK